MAGYISDDTRKVTTHRLVEMKQRGERISMLTSYDYTMAQIVDGAGMDVILVGDSASNVMAGNVTTLPITLDQMIYHAKSVVRGVKRAMVVVDMPFGSYQGNEMEGLASAIRIMKESHADALKLEGGEEIIDTVKRIISAGIPVMGHLGLMPQSINKYGTYTVRAKDDNEAEKLIRDAHLLEEAGCFAIASKPGTTEQAGQIEAPTIEEETEIKTLPWWKSILYIIGGLAALIFGGQLFVDGATGIARNLGVSESIIGLTLVAGGTSLPELATSIVAALKKNPEIAIGNVIGSNLFNIFFVLGCSASITPLHLSGITNFDLFTLVGSGILLWLFGLFFAKRTITRIEGGIMILCYVAYTVVLIYNI